MHTEKEIHIYEFVWAISEAVDLISAALNNHHKKVAYISSSIALDMGLQGEAIQDILLAAMLHDIGVFSTEESIKITSFDAEHHEMDSHAIIGYELIRKFLPLAKVAEIIKKHHAAYREPGDDVSLYGNILHIADRLSILYDQRREILEQVPDMVASVLQKHCAFNPAVSASLKRLEKKEYIWIEAFTQEITLEKIRGVPFSRQIIDVETLREFAKTLAQIIDFRSRFTATHSSGVAAVAMEISGMSGFSRRECKMMEVAGFLHDLGKVAVPNEVLEKEGALNDSEFNQIRKHAYYTYVILNKIKGLEHIALWASQHHERPDGNGYPFHVKDSDFSKLSRIMVVADIVTALTEDRPYRAGMERAAVESILKNMAENNTIDKDIVDLVTAHFAQINNTRAAAQQTARKEYEAFYNDTHTLCSVSR